MIQDVKAFPVSFYFNPDGATSFFIPKYQREYVWGWSNWDALFNDLNESPSGHFLGSIICVNGQTDSMAGSRLELIDGQQRFTTISLLFCALYEKLKTNPEPDDDFNVEIVNLKNRIFIKTNSQWRFEPSEQMQNKTDFQRILSELFPKLVTAPKGLANFGNRRIAKAYKYFRERLMPLTIAHGMELLEKLKSAILVKIEVQSHSDAFMLFESINNRGIPLSAIDIIKNNLLAELDKRPDYGIDRAFDEWKELIYWLDEPPLQERFLRHLYNTFKYLGRVEVKGCPRATRSNLITIYDAILRRHPVWFIGQLLEKGKTYSLLHYPDSEDCIWSEDTKNRLLDLQHLGAAPAYAFLLWVSQVARSQSWDEGLALGQTAALLTKWFFWRNLTDTPPTRELDPMFVQLIGELLKQIRNGSIGNLEEFLVLACDWLVARAAPEDVCDARLKGDVYLDNYEATRFMLCKLEEVHQTRENTRDLWAHDANDRPVFTVEHILPKTENLGPGWVAMLELNSQDTADAVRQRCAHQLGNLTLSGYNSKLGTMEFIKKRDRQNDKDDFIGYRNGLYLNADLATRTEWNEAAMTARTEKMLKEVKSILSLRSSS
ncbi:DUF262 domain-containing protein [Pseudomonas plecoglossicida]|uniref:DUF262 domain-containing protein n=1 Tax=Pseudomonas plecoglossicida TaxID=70775 RepID=UPI0015E3C0BA|nr:DUF262 domain-containing protein [Pseudomonas plecoglossicida]MBA1198253.1 DUF262 domain-containing protein [Pseudomonas plecoglossicida]